MLATILPGLRDLRTPLTAGLLYFLAVWLWFGSSRVSPPLDNVLVARVQDLYDFTGQGAAISAVSLAAYLVGSLLVVREAKWTTWLARRPEALLAWSYDRKGMVHHLLRERLWPTKFASQTVPGLARLISAVDRNEDPFAPGSMRLDRWISDQFDDLVSRGWTLQALRAHTEVPEGLKRWASDIREHTFPDQYQGIPPEDLEPFLDRRGLEGALRQVLESEREAVLVRMQIEHDALFDGYDRLASEAELRLSIFVPTTVLVGVCAVLWSPWILLGLAAPWLLLRRGVRLRQEADERVTQALTTGTVSSPTVQILKDIGRADAGHQAAVYPRKRLRPTRR